MEIYRNKSFTKRDHECENIVYAVVNNDPFYTENREPQARFGNWESVTEIAEDVQALFIIAGVEYWGYL